MAIRGSVVGRVASFTSRRIALVFAGASLVAVAMVGGCSLGLDESLISPAADDGGADTSVPQFDGGVPKADSSAPAKDAGTDASLPATCAKDGDCVSNRTCLTGRCDLSRNACVYDVCPTTNTTCSAAVCTDGKCGAPVVQKFAGARIAVPSGISCGTIAHCIAAVHPWVVLGTNAGVLVYPAIPADANPTPIVISDIPFLAQSIVASGNRIFVLGGLINAGTTKVQIAWFDLPLDPTSATAITAQATLATNPHGTGDELLPFPMLQALLTQQGGNPLFAGNVAAPFAEGTTITQYDTDGGASGAQTAGATGSRVALFKTNGAASSIQLITGAGSAADSIGAAIDTTTMLGPVNAAAFTSGPDGSLRTNYQTQVVMAPNVTYKIHVAELLANGTATTLSTAFAVDLDTYTNPPGGQLLGGVAWIDSTSVIAASAVTPGASSHITWVDDKKSTPKSFALDTTPVNNVIVAGSAGIGWTATNDSVSAASLYYISPQCAP